MLKFSRRKTSSKSDETVCISNGCVGGRNGEQVWPSGASPSPIAVDGASVDTRHEDCVSSLQKETSTALTSGCDAQNKTRRTKPLSVLHVIRDKLKPSSSKCRSVHSTDCTSETQRSDPEAGQDCCTLANFVNGRENAVIEDFCDHDYCSCDTTDAAEKCISRVGKNVTTGGQPLSTNIASFSDQLMIADSVEQNALNSALPCVAVKPHSVHGGLVLSQLSNIVSSESCMKNDKIATEGSSRLPLSPLSNPESGLDTPEDHQPVKWTLANELLRLSRYGWYWGPVSREEAEEKLAEQPEGAFLVRDSTDDRYLFSLSFRSSGRTLHTRVEYCNGEFSFYAQPRSDSYRSMAELIEQCVAESQSGIYCYSRGTSGAGSQSYPVKLTRPVSRFAQVRSLQYLCRFVIRQHTRVDHIQNLPLPVSVKGWLKENQY